MPIYTTKTNPETVTGKGAIRWVWKFAAKRPWPVRRRQKGVYGLCQNARVRRLCRGVNWWLCWYVESVEVWYVAVLSECRYVDTTDSTDNTLPPKSTTSRKPSSSVQIQIHRNSHFECTARYRGIWVSRFSGFWGYSIFSGKCRMCFWSIGMLTCCCAFELLTWQFPLKMLPTRNPPNEKLRFLRKSRLEFKLKFWSNFPSIFHFFWDRTFSQFEIGQIRTTGPTEGVPESPFYQFLRSRTSLI